MFMQYWQNAQKLPVYVVTGELTGESFDEPPADLRAVDAERVPGAHDRVQGPGARVVRRWSCRVIFDWMGRKDRANGG